MESDEIIKKLFELFGESPDSGEIDRVVALFKKEACERKKRREIEEMKAVISSRGALFVKKLPMFTDLFKDAYDLNHIATAAAEYLSCSGNLLPTLLPVMGSGDKRYPIQGLLKAGGVVSPKELVIEDVWDYPTSCYPNEPYIVFGVNTLVFENISPQEADEIVSIDRGCPFNLDKAAAIFLQSDIDLGQVPYSILVMGVSSEKQYLVIKVSQTGEKILVLVPWKEKIPGRVIVPLYMGEEGFISY